MAKAKKQVIEIPQVQNVLVDKTALNKFIADADTLHAEHDKKYKEVYDRVQSAKEEYEGKIADTKKAIEDMESGAVEFDFTEYNSNVHLLPTFQKEMDDVEQSLEQLFASYERTYNSGKETIKNTQLEQLIAEYEKNRLDIVSAMFHQMMGVVELSKQLTQLGHDYRDAVQNLGYQGRIYADFNPRLGSFVARFLLNPSAIKYSTHMQTALHDFEEEYFNPAP